MVEKPVILKYDVGSWQRSTVGHTDGEVGRRGKDWIKLMTQLRPRKEDVVRSLLKSMKQAVEKKKESTGPCRQSNQGICLRLNSEYR